MILNAYLSFDGNCREAFTFYHECLGGELQAMMRYDEMPVCDEMPPEAATRIAHARLVTDGQFLMGSDCMPGQPYEGIKGASLCVNVDTLAEAQRLFDALSDGGTVMMALQETFWAKSFAVFSDRFGASWMINCEKEKEQ